MIEPFSQFLVRNINPEAKRKAMFVAKCKGKDLSTAIRDFISELAEEFDRMNKK